MEKRNITSPNIYRTSDNYYDVSTLQGIKHIVFSVRLENWYNNDLLHYIRAIQDYVANNNLATFNSSVTTGQSDYSSRDEKLYGLANYPYDIISVDDIDKSEREYEGSPLNKILNISLNKEGNQVCFAYGKWQFNIFMSLYMTCKRCKPVPNFGFSRIFRSRFLSIKQTRKRMYDNIILEASPYACNNNDERRRENHIMNVMNIKVTIELRQ